MHARTGPPPSASGRPLRLVAIGETDSLRAALRLAAARAGVELVGEGGLAEGNELVRRTAPDVVVVEATGAEGVLAAAALAEGREFAPGVVILGVAGSLDVRPSGRVALLPADASLDDVLLAAGRVGWRPGPTASPVGDAPARAPSLLERVRAAETALRELVGMLEPGAPAATEGGPASAHVRLRAFRSFGAVMAVLERVGELDAVAAVRPGAVAGGVVEFAVDGIDAWSLAAALEAGEAGWRAALAEDGTLEIRPGMATEDPA